LKRNKAMKKAAPVALAIAVLASGVVAANIVHKKNPFLKQSTMDGLVAIIVIASVVSIVGFNK